MGSRRLSGGLLVFLSSALLYLSFFLSILAPTPLVWVHLARGRGPAFAVSVANAALVYLLGGWTGLVGYVVFSIACGWTLAELSRRLAVRPHDAVVNAGGVLFRLLTGTGLGILVVAGLAVAAWAQIAHVSPWAELGRGLDWLGEQMLSQAPSGTMDAADWAVQKEEWLRNFPATVMIAVLLQSWVAVTLVLRLNPARIRDRLGLPAGFSRLWKNPEMLVWPTIAAGFGVIVLTGSAADACWNLLKVCLALYGVQGFSILSGIFDLWRLRGFARSLGFFLVLTVMLPLVLALGFFDLWFDFRGKLRQS